MSAMDLLNTSHLTHHFPAAKAPALYGNRGFLLFG